MKTSEILANIVFRHASAREMGDIAINGPYKRDAVTAIMLAYMIHCHDSVVVYSHGTEAHFFHLRRSDQIIDSVKRKCSEMNTHLLSGTLPPQCRSHKCRACHTLSKEKT
jgi:hypothetical protein